MDSIIKLKRREIKATYNMIKQYYVKYLKKEGVKLPRLMGANKKFTKDALTLVYLSIGYPKTKKVTKTELTSFMRNFYPEINDVQQARHLGAQFGWWVVAGGRDNVVIDLKRGEYQLHTLERPYPDFKKQHRVSDSSSWKDIKSSYGCRCATCGSKEGEPHFHWSGTKTVLQNFA